MLTSEEARKLGLRAWVDKIGYDFCKQHEDTIVYAYGDEDGIMECYVGVDDNPNDFDERIHPVILDTAKYAPYYARCNVLMQDGTITFLDFCLPKNQREIQ